VLELLQLLQTIVTVPSSPPPEFSFALDWYKNPVGEDSYNWPNTKTGDLVNSGKYRFRSQPELQRQAGLDLSNRLCETIRKHPLLRNASMILDVPGHDSQRVSFGSRLAATVARSLGKTMLRVDTRSAFRAESKNRGGAQEALLEGEFIVPGAVQGQSVLIVDDVIRSGTSMAAVAKAARMAGAQQVLGICAVRTMRR
jgi:predicted amidophosphoribosyltransferase